jgi:hypothetical protein
MSGWYDSQNKPRRNFRQLLQKRIDEANPRRKLTAQEAKRRKKLETIALHTRTFIKIKGFYGG